MIRRIAPLVAVTVAAAFLAPICTAGAKDDPAAQKAAEEAVRKEYKAAKKVVSADLAYFIDTTKLDSRWSFEDVKPPEDPDQGAMFRGAFTAGGVGDAAAIQFYAAKCIQKNAVKKTEYSHEFKAWGKQVKVAELEKMAQGYYEDFRIQASNDFVKDKSTPAEKHGVGPAKYWGCAVGPDPETKARVRKDWYVWQSSLKAGTYTWTFEATTQQKFIDMPEIVAKIEDLVKNIKELKDPRLK